MEANKVRPLLLILLTTRSAQYTEEQVMTIGQFLIMAFGLLMYLGIFCFLVIRLIFSGVDYLRATAGNKVRLAGQNAAYDKRSVAAAHGAAREHASRHTPYQALRPVK